MVRWLLLLIVLFIGAGCTSKPPAPPRNREVTFAAVGDVLFARGVGNQIDQHGADYPFSKTKDILSNADIAFCNLECPLSKKGVPRHQRFQFRANPEFAETLAGNGFDIADLANNHTLDYGREAMLDTIKAVEAAGTVSVGAGIDRNDALRLRIIKKNGLRVGLLAYTDILPFGTVLLSDKPTVAAVDSDQLSAEINAAKANCDVLVVSFHWGIEYAKHPTQRQKKLAHICIDNGADLVLGHHPHVLQPIEEYKGKPIVYSMGGFVWDSHIFGSDKSAIYLIKLRKSQAKISRIIPVDVKKCCPAPM